MGRDEDQGFAWLRLMARLDAKGEPLDDTPPRLASSVIDLVAVAGCLRNYAEVSSNDIDAAAAFLLLRGLWRHCAKYRAALLIGAWLWRYRAKWESARAGRVETQTPRGLPMNSLTFPLIPGCAISPAWSHALQGPQGR